MITLSCSCIQSVVSLWLYCHRFSINSHSVSVIDTGYSVAIATPYNDTTWISPFILPHAGCITKQEQSKELQVQYTLTHTYISTPFYLSDSVPLTTMLRLYQLKILRYNSLSHSPCPFCLIVNFRPFCPIVYPRSSGLGSFHLLSFCLLWVNLCHFTYST